MTQWTLRGVGADPVIEAARFGFEAIQIESGGGSSAQPIIEPACPSSRRYVWTAEKYGVRIVGMAVRFLDGFGMTDAKGSRGARLCWSHIIRATDSALDMGIPLVYLSAFEASQMDSGRDIVRTIAVLERVADHTRDCGLELAIELSLNAQQTLMFVSETRALGVRILFDTLNATLLDLELLEMIEQLRPALASQVHVKDACTGDGRSVAVGDGIGITERTVKKIAEDGRSRTWVLENDYRRDPELATGGIRRLRRWIGREATN